MRSVVRKTNAELPNGSSAVLGSLVPSESGVAEERGPVALRPRLSLGLPLSSCRCSPTIGACTGVVKRAVRPTRATRWPDRRSP